MTERRVETVFYDSDTGEVVTQDEIAAHVMRKITRKRTFLILPEERPRDWLDACSPKPPELAPERVRVDYMPLIVTTWRSFERGVHAINSLHLAERDA